MSTTTYEMPVVAPTAAAPAKTRPETAAPRIPLAFATRLALGGEMATPHDLIEMGHVFVNGARATTADADIPADAEVHIAHAPPPLPSRQPTRHAVLAVMALADTLTRHGLHCTPEQAIDITTTLAAAGFHLGRETA